MIYIIIGYLLVGLFSATIEWLTCTPEMDQEVMESLIRENPDDEDLRDPDMQYTIKVLAHVFMIFVWPYTFYKIYFE